MVEITMIDVSFAHINYYKHYEFEDFLKIALKTCFTVNKTNPKAIMAKIIVAPEPRANNKVRTKVARRLARVLVVCNGAEANLWATMLVKA